MARIWLHRLVLALMAVVMAVNVGSSPAAARGARASMRMMTADRAPVVAPMSDCRHDARCKMDGAGVGMARACCLAPSVATIAHAPAVAPLRLERRIARTPVADDAILASARPSTPRRPPRIA